MSSVLPPVQPSASGPYRPEGDHVSYTSSSSTAALAPGPRPNFVRRETDQILSYYQSEHAGRPFDYATAAHADSEPQRLPTTSHSRKGSTASSASDYSSEYSSESLPEPERAFVSASQTTTPVRAHFALQPEQPPAHARNASNAPSTSSYSSQNSSNAVDTPAGTHAELPSQQPLAHARNASNAWSTSSYSSQNSSNALATPELGLTPVRTHAELPSEQLHAHIHARNASNVSSTSSYSSEHPSNARDHSELGSVSQVSTPVRTNAELPPEQPHARGGAARHSRRPSVPSEGGADRRRLAIVEMDAAAQRSVSRKRSKGGESQSPSSAMSGSTLFSRRGMNINGLALVAPPDASPATYTDLTPPSTAPVVAERASQPPPSASSHYHAHARSASEAVDAGGRARRLHHKSSRDVGIVGLSSASTASDSLGPASPTSSDYHSYVVQREGLGVPVFQTPAKSRSPSPGGGGTPDLSDTSSASAYPRSPEQRLLSTPIFGMEDGIVTPGIGEWKDIQQPVVGPVIVGLSPEMMQRTQQQRPASAAPQQHSLPSSSVQSPTSRSPQYPGPSSTSSAASPYLHYQPGVHATAGPLPPPPRSIFDNNPPPPRPPRFHTPVPTGTRREIEAIKEKLQLPQSVSAKLAARTPPEANRRLGHDPTPSRSDTRDSEESSYSQDNESSVKLVPSQSVHRREGAFPPSTILSSPPVQEPLPLQRASEEQSTSSHVDVRPVVVIEPEEEHDDIPPRERKDSDRRSGLELRRQSSWVSLSQEGAERESSPNGKSAVLPTLPISRSASSISGGSSSSSGSSKLPIPPPKNARSGSDDERQQNSLAPSSFRATLTNLKRFSSLPRTPSRSSRSSKRSESPDMRRSLSPSAAPIHVELPLRRMIRHPTKISSWPQAMVARDVTMLRSPRERAQAYADKINELAEYDCGLREWMASQGRPGLHSKSVSQRTAHQTLHPTLPAELGGMPRENRHVSHGSLASQATFPIRADAYTATDLSTRSIDIVPPTAPPTTLPYPSLAQANLTRAQTRSSTLLSSPTKTLAMLPGGKGGGTGFFASLGRKTSTRREKGLSSLAPSPQSPTKVLTKRPPAMALSRSNPTPQSSSSSASPRDAPLPTAPAIPGGPRAAPGRIQRAKTYSVAASPPQPPPEMPLASAQNSQRQSAVARRPSLFARARPGHMSVGPPAPSAMDPAFQRQVDKLAAILPHADRAILAGYLRRAGEDILAIGQYLEDEKNGTLRRD